MKKATIICALLFILIFSISNHHPFLPKQVFAAENPTPTLTIEGDLVITGTERSFEKEVVEVHGNIRVESGGTISLKNATLKIVQTRRMQYNMTFLSSNLKATDNSMLTSNYGFFAYFRSDSSLTASSFDASHCSMNFTGRTRVSMTDSKLTYIRAYDSAVITLENSRIKPSTIELSKTTPALEAHGSSILSLSRTELREAFFYDNSFGSFSYAKIGVFLIAPVSLPVRLYNSSRLTVENSEEKWVMETYHFSSALIRNTTLWSAKTQHSSLISIWDTTIKKGITSYDSSNVFLFNSKIQIPTGFEQYLVAYDSSKVSLFSTTIKGLLSAHDTSIITADGSTIEWLTARGSSKLKLSKCTFPSMYFNDFSQASISKSKIGLLHTYDWSRVSILDPNATELHVRDSSIVSIKGIRGANIKQLNIYCKNTKGAFNGLKPDTYNQWNSLTDASIVVDSGGSAPNITLDTVKISDGWSLFFSGSTNVSITDSKITHLRVSGTTTAHLLNTNISSYDISSKAKIHVYWYLKVHAAGDATVKVSYYNGTAQESKTTDGNGLASFIVLEKTIDNSGTYATEDYLVDVTSPEYSQSQWVTINRNMELVLTAPVPWWQQYWYLILLAAIGIIIAIATLKLKTRKPI